MSVKHNYYFIMILTNLVTNLGYGCFKSTSIFIHVNKFNVIDNIKYKIPHHLFFSDIKKSIYIVLRHIDF